MFDYVPFSDANVLSELIRNRISLDVGYKEKVYPSGFLSSNGGLIFNENILTVFIDLDRLIDSASLSKKQRTVVDLLMRGWSIQDIADESGKTHQSISAIFDRALDALIAHHNERWRGVTLGELRKDEYDRWQRKQAPPQL